MITLKDLQNLEREDIVTYIQESDRIDPELKAGDIFKYVFGNGMYVKLEKIGCKIRKNRVWYFTQKWNLLCSTRSIYPIF